jgi:hypothetical protein
VNARAVNDRSDRGDGGTAAWRSSSNQEEVYVGSRALLGTGFRAELGLSTSGSADRSADVRSSYRDESVRLALYDPAIVSSPWFAGLDLKHSENRNRLTNENASERSTGRGVFEVATAVVGRRFDLLALSAGLMRLYNVDRYEFVSESETKGDNFHDFSTELYVDMRYSEKSGLVRLEPGVVAAVEYLRSLAPSISTPLIQASAERTWLLGNGGATPAASYVLNYLSVCNSDRCSAILDRTYDLSLTYERSLSAAVVGGLTFGYYAEADGDRTFAFNPSHRPRLKASVGASLGQFLVDIAFIYGYPGLDEGIEDLLNPHHNRLTE